MPLNQLNQNRSMISKLNFPREALLAEGLGEILFHTLVRALLLIPALLYYGANWGPAAWLSPLVALLMVLFATGMGLLILPIGSLYQDVSRFLSVGLPFWMILTPIIYAPFTTFPGSLLNWLNPASPLLMCSRDLLLLGSCGNPAALWYGLIAIPIFLLGLVVYRLAMPALIERMTS
jgi:lipopolysaccharide transport system permease protein